MLVVDSSLPNSLLANYNPNNDRITVNATNSLGQEGRWAVAHEYGHAVHHRAIAGFTATSCPSPNQASNSTCGAIEGFAEFHAAITQGLFGWRSAEHETNNSAATGGPSGFLIPDAVAEVLVDLSDGLGDDPMSYGAPWVVNAISACGTAKSTSWANCFEYQMPSSVWTSFFAPLSQPNGNIAVGKPSSYDFLDVRTNWVTSWFPGAIVPITGKDGGNDCFDANGFPVPC